MESLQPVISQVVEEAEAKIAVEEASDASASEEGVLVGGRGWGLLPNTVGFIHTDYPSFTTGAPYPWPELQKQVARVNRMNPQVLWLTGDLKNMLKTAKKFESDYK